MTGTARARCSACRYSYRLRRDGTVQAHRLFVGSTLLPGLCTGSHHLPLATRTDGVECGVCEEHVLTQPHLVHALASVGISRGMSTVRMFREYIAGYHERGHKEAA